MANAHAKEQLREFLRFFDGKRGLYVTEVEAVINDVRESRLYDDVYSKDDVEEMFTELQTTVKERVRKDLETNLSMSALVLEQVLNAAADQSVKLSLDMSRTEDEAALNRMRELSSALFLGDADLRKKGAVMLGSMRDEATRVTTENYRLTEENAALKERYVAMQAQAGKAVQDAAQLAAKLEAASVELKALRSGTSVAAATSAAHEAELEKLRATVAQLHSQAEGAKTEVLAVTKEREAHVNRSKPFLQMKAMLVRKNAQLAELRAKVAKYEPEADEEETK